LLVVDRDFIIPLLTKPIAVIACSARAASGHAAAAPPSSVMNSRRFS
jgi:hydroxymethylglutaryl-CoA reductase